MITSLTSSAAVQILASINGLGVVSAIRVDATTSKQHSMSFIIPNGNTYLITITAGNFTKWMELR